MGKIAGRAPAGSKNMPISHADEAFAIRCQARNLTPATCGWYKQRLKLFAEFLELRGVARVAKITPHLIRLYLEKMRADKIGSGTIARDYGALKCFFGFLAREHLIPDNPITLVEKPKKEDKLITPLSLDQVRTLLSKINQKRFEGLRSSEVMNLRKDKIDFEKGTLRVMGKGNKERKVPCGTISKQALWNYLRRRGDIPGQDLVFVSHFGIKLDRSWIIRAFRCLAKRPGIQGVGYPFIPSVTRLRPNTS